MNFSKFFSCGAAIALLGVLFSPADATVQVLEAEAGLQHWVLCHHCVSPCAGASFTHSVEEGVTFDLQTSSYDGSCVESNWAGQCNSNGFTYNGEILPVIEGDLGWYVYLQSEISVLLDVTSPTRISAVRNIEGMLSPSLHTVSLTLPDGTTHILLGSTATDSAEQLLKPGVHRVTFSIETDELWDIPFSYSGSVEVNWERSWIRKRKHGAESRACITPSIYLESYNRLAYKICCLKLWRINYAIICIASRLCLCRIHGFICVGPGCRCTC